MSNATERLSNVNASQYRQDHRTLPNSLIPVHGESLGSFVDRLSARLDVPRNTVLFRLGLTERDHNKSRPKQYGILLSEETSRTLTEVARLERGEVEAMLLSSYQNVCLDLTELLAGRYDQTPNVAVREWVFFRGSWLCPECLKESGGVWQLRWKLPWSFACTRHGRLHVSQCPGCLRRTNFGRQDSTMSPPFSSLVPVPTLCGNAPLVGMTKRGRAAKPCGYPLTEMEGEVADEAILRVQSRIDRVLRGDTTEAGDLVLSPREFFSDLRSLAGMILTAGQVHDLGDAPDAVARAFEEHVAERNAGESEREEWKASGKSWRTAPKQRVYSKNPETPALAAGVLTLASDLLEIGYGERFMERFAVYGRRLKADGYDFARFNQNFVLSERLQEAIRPLWVQRKRSPSLFSSEALLADPDHDRLSVLTADDIPQSYWREDFERDLLPLIGGISVERARRAFSMWALKKTRTMTWKEATEEFGLPYKKCLAAKDRLFSRLKQDGNFDRVDELIRRKLKDLAEDPNRVDYGSRRERLKSLTDFDRGWWREWCRRQGIHPGGKGARSGFAATWLWCELTGGDFLLSPSFQRENSRYRRYKYRLFMKRNLPEMRDRLIELGDTLI